MRVLLRLVAAALLGAMVAPSAAQTPTVEDAEKTSPQYYTILFENDKVRVFEYRLPPGEVEQMHSHPEGVIRFLSDATVRVTLEDGSKSIASSTNGDVQWRDHTIHAIENIGETDAVAFVVETKSAAESIDSS